jgi:carbonic anhydrase
MKNYIPHSAVPKVLMSLVFIPILFGCSQIPSEEEASQEPAVGLHNDVLTQEDQAKLTPQKIIQILKDGNVRFTQNNLTHRDHSAQVRKSIDGQYPKAIVLSCIDSRVPVEDVFDRGIGDLFVARVAGNVINSDILGSMEYSCKVAGAKLILVLGHEHCGAVTAAIKGVELGNITDMVAKIHPAIERNVVEADGSKTDPAYIHKVCLSNVEYSLEQIRLHSPILREMEKNGELLIVGAVYDMDTGMVEFL